jgi:hypothetical protein
MSYERMHIDDAELLLATEGELSPQRLTNVRKHLGECAWCRTRAGELGDKLGVLGAAYRKEFDSQVPSRPTLEAIFSSRMASESRRIWTSVPVNTFRDLFGHWGWVGVAAVMLLGVVAGLQVRHLSASSTTARAIGAEIDSRPLPDTRFTPGAVRTVDARAVCQDRPTSADSAIPAKMQGEVFREYRMVNARPQDYEIDYLITPELGGADDIRNLWPEPYGNTQWNARVKDQLEDHLHEMVCHGQLDLSTAQQDIATDWISAYKKYFHTEAPLSARQATIRN